MPGKIDENLTYFSILIRAEAEGFPSLTEMTSFLADIDIAYIISRISTDPYYSDISIMEALISSKDSSLNPEDRLIVKEISHQSPLELLVVVSAVPAAVGAIWGVVQIVEKIVNFSPNRRKLLAEIEKLERENLAARKSTPPSKTKGKGEVNLLIDRQQANRLYEQVADRLTDGPISISEAEIRVVKGRSLMRQKQLKRRK